MEKLFVKSEVRADGILCGWDSTPCAFIRANFTRGEEFVHSCQLFDIGLVSRYFRSFLRERVLRCQECLEEAKAQVVEESK
jgi:hypothetical protein